MKQSDNWRTPEKIYSDLDLEFHFNFDPCPYPKPNWNGLKIDWGTMNFVNPPYSETEKWVKKALEQQMKGNSSILLLRLDASTRWFRDLVLPYSEIRLFDDRLHFVNEDGKSSRSDHASILAIIDARYKVRLNLPIIFWRSSNDNFKVLKFKKIVSDEEMESINHSLEG